LEFSKFSAWYYTFDDTLLGSRRRIKFTTHPQASILGILPIQILDPIYNKIHEDLFSKQGHIYA